MRRVPTAVMAAGVAAFLLATSPWTHTASAANAYVDTAVQIEEEMTHFPLAWDSRDRPSAGCGGGCAFLFGGNVGPSLMESDRIWAHNPSTGSFVQKNGRLPQPMLGMSGDRVGQYVYLFGGHAAGPQYFDTILRYDIDADTVSTLSTKLPEPRTLSKAVYSGTRILIFSGSSNGNPINTALSFNPADETIEVVGSGYPQLFSDACIAWTGSRIVMTTTEQSTGSRKIQAFDPTNGQMTPYSTSIDGDPTAGCVAAGSYVWMFGGVVPNGWGDLIHRFDPSSGQLTTVAATLPYARFQGRAVMAGTRAYLYGGGDYTCVNNSCSSAYTGKILRFEPDAPDPTPTFTSATITPSTSTTQPAPPPSTTPLSFSSAPLPIVSTTGASVSPTPSTSSSSVAPTNPEDGAAPPSLMDNPTTWAVGGAAAAAPLGYLLFGAVARARASRRPSAATVVAAPQGSSLQVDGLQITRDRTVLQSVTFEVPAGRLVLLLGPSGSGKSTLLQAIAGLIPARGGLRIRGHRVRPGDPDAKNAIGFVPQDLQLSTNLTALENVVSLGAQAGVSASQAKGRAPDLLAVLGLDGVAGRTVARLTAGERRRVAVAAALVNHPSTVLLDGPASGLDATARKALWATLQRMASERGVGVLATTNLVGDAPHADIVGILAQGRLLAWGTPRALTRLLPGDGRCLEVEFEDFDAGLRRRFEAVAAKAMKSDLVTTFAAQLHGVRCFAKDPGRAARELPALLHAAGIQVRSTRIDDVTLEDVVLQLTKRPVGPR